MSLETLPDITFIDSDPAVVEERLFSTYETVSGRTLYPGDPVRLFLEAVAMEVALARQEANWAALQNLVAFATGERLDHLGALLGVTRLAASAARTTLRFTVSSALAFAVTIPAGTRATPDGNLMFSTEASAVIPSGSLYVDVAAVCQETGAAGNGYVSGQISRLVDTLSWISGVSNVTLSLGGADEESDDRFRERIVLAPESFSVAGPEGAYRFWALTAHQDIADVAVLSPNPVEVQVYPLLTDGGLPGQEYLDLVESAVNARDARPLTDQVSVLPPVGVVYDTDITWWLGSSSAALASIVQEKVEAAVDDFRAWQRAKLGRDHNPTELARRIREAGAKRVEIRSPVFLALGGNQVAQDGARTVIYGGVEEE